MTEIDCAIDSTVQDTKRLQLVIRYHIGEEKFVERIPLGYGKEFEEFRKAYAKKVEDYIARKK